jgi:hypothetical protein
VADRNTVVLGLGGIVAGWVVTRALDQLLISQDELGSASRSSRSRRRRR